MTLALIDVPRCVDVDAAYVGAPRASASTSRSDGIWGAEVPGLGTWAFRRTAVEQCLDTAGVLRSYREPLEGETWLTPAASERRLLAQVNAILALGPDALADVKRLALDADVPEPARVFAALFVLGSSAGRRWLAPAADAFVTAAVRSANEAAAAIEALSLCPNPEIGALLAASLGDSRPRVRASAILILAYRHELSESQWQAALQDDDFTVVAATLTAPLDRYDRPGCHRAFQRLFAADPGETVTKLALRAALAIGLEFAYVRAHEIVRHDPTWAAAAYILALADDLPAARVRDMLDGPSIDDGVRAAGVLGDLDLIPDLLELVDRPSSPAGTRAAAKQALATITGLDFHVVDDPVQAIALWSAHEARFRRGVRYRRGEPWSLEGLYRCLQVGPASRSVRQETYFEMRVATQSRLPRFSAYDFVAVQRTSLARIEQWLAASPRAAKAGR